MPRPDLNRKSVLIANLYFPPDTAATAPIFADLAQMLHDGGYRTTVLCGRPSYRPTSRRRWRPLRREDNGFLVERVGSTALPLRSIRTRLLNYLSFLGLASIRVLGGSRPDVAVAGSDPPMAIAVALVAARGKPVVYFLQDLHPDTALSAGWISPGRIAAIWEWLHLRALRRCAAIVCLGEEMRARLIHKGVPPERISIVANGAPPPAPIANDRTVERLRAGSPFTLVHAGNIGVAGPWETIAKAQELVGRSAEFVFVGGGARESELREWGLRVEPWQSDVAAVMAAGDLQVVAQRAEMEGLLVPSKLYSALVHGRPILAVVPESSEVALTVRRWRCGLVADPNDPQDVAEKVRNLAADPDRLHAMTEQARTAGESYQRPAVFKPLIELIEKVAADRSAARGRPIARERL